MLKTSAQMHKTQVVLLLVLVSLVCAGCGRQMFTGKREARGVWLSRFEYTGERARFTPEQAQERIRTVLERARKARFNMVFFQARGNGDAFYKSGLEPWSDLLTGTLGQDPGWDPLQYAIDIAHRQGLELHVWINTFPAWRGVKPPTESTPRQIYLEHPNWLVADSQGVPMPLADHYVSLSPGVPAARQHILDVVMDIVEHYDVDGVHFDYIRYPEGGTIRGYSHDSISVARFNSVEGNPYQLSWDAWQREQVNQFVFDVYNRTTARKPWVKVSAAVIGKYEGTGWTAYDAAYQDPRRWMELGKMDFIVPMVYWEREHPTHPFVPLIQQWADRVAYGRYVLPGVLVGLERRYGWSELAAEVDEVRKLGLPGVVYFSASGLDDAWENLGVQEFPYWSLVPPMPWKDMHTPPPPEQLSVQWEGEYVKLQWQAPAIPEPLAFVVYRSETGRIDVNDVKEIVFVTGRDTTSYTDARPPARQVVYAVSAVNRNGNESPVTKSVAVHPPALAHR